MATLETLIGNPVDTVFRRVYMKRRLSATGKFETSWQNITPYVKRWGSFKSAVDDVRLNRFTHSGLNLVCRNDEGKFNPEENVTSLWNGYLSRYRTLVKVEAGYLDGSTELPTDTTQGIFVLDRDLPISGISNEAMLNCQSLVSIFDEVRAADVAGLGPTMTASEIVAKIRDHTDGSSNFILREFVTSTAWTIQSTTAYYNLATSTALGSMSCWDLMEKMAETEGFILFVNRTGGIEFRDRNERTSTAAFSFYGQGFARPSIIGLEDYREALDKYFNFFRFKWKEEDTTTSYVTAGTTTVVDPSNTSWKHGSRVYQFSNTFFQTSTTAQTAVNALFTMFSGVKDEVTIVSKFTPQLEISDKVLLYYRSYDLAGATLWDGFDWDGEDWADESGENFDWNGIAFKVLSKETRLEDFTTTLVLREI